MKRTVNYNLLPEPDKIIRAMMNVLDYAGPEKFQLLVKLLMEGEEHEFDMGCGLMLGIEGWPCTAMKKLFLKKGEHK